MIESDPAVSRRVCMETSIDQADRWQGPQSRVTLDRFHRAPGVVALRLLQLIAFGKRESSRVHSYYIHDPSGHQKDRANRVGGEVGLSLLPARSLLCLASGELGSIMVALLIAPFWSSVLLPFLFFFFFFFSFLPSFGLSPLPSLLRGERTEGARIQITEGIDNVVSNLIIVALH